MFFTKFDVGAKFLERLKSDAKQANRNEFDYEDCLFAFRDGKLRKTLEMIEKYYDHQVTIIKKLLEKEDDLIESKKSDAGMEMNVIRRKVEQVMRMCALISFDASKLLKIENVRAEFTDFRHFFDDLVNGLGHIDAAARDTASVVEKLIEGIEKKVKAYTHAEEELKRMEDELEAT